MEAILLGNDIACVIKILRDFIRDDADVTWIRRQAPLTERMAPRRGKWPLERSDGELRDSTLTPCSQSSFA